MAPLPPRINGESSKAYHHFCEYVKIDRGRTVQALARQMGRENYASQLRRWSSRWNWEARAAAYDRAALSEALSTRGDTIELVRTTLLGEYEQYLENMRDLARNAEKESVRLQANIRLLELAGVTVTKRVELSGPEGGRLEPLAAAVVGLNMTADQIMMFIKKVKGDDS